MWARLFGPGSVRVVMFLKWPFKILKLIKDLRLLSSFGLLSLYLDTHDINGPTRLDRRECDPQF